MKLLPPTYLAAGILGALFFLAFAMSSYRERRRRAVIASLISLVIFATAWAWWYVLFVDLPAALALPLVGMAILMALFFLPLGRSRQLKVVPCEQQVDERDVMFAREEYQPGTATYDAYYARRPEYRAIDDKIRELPELLAPGGRYYVAGRSEKVVDVFRQIQALATQVDGDIAPERPEVTPETMTTEIKRRLREMGAAASGVTVLDQRFVYSHVGRGPEEWGAPIENSHRYAIAFVVEMDYGEVEQAPDLPITEEAARKYLMAAKISVDLARHIRSLGYPARAHISDSNYQIMLPPVARDAGLGELGRIGYLISPKFGARLRLGAVTTDLPLVTDKRVAFGLLDFCDKCLKCAANCPSAAIPKGAMSTVLGVDKWPLNVERCVRYWRLAGTDCGICMKVCPYSHPPTWIHNLVRAGIKRSSFARTVSVWGDDLFYGRKTDYPRMSSEDRMEPS